MSFTSSLFLHKFKLSIVVFVFFFSLSSILMLSVIRKKAKNNTPTFSVHESTSLENSIEFHNERSSTQQQEEHEEDKYSLSYNGGYPSTLAKDWIPIRVEECLSGMYEHSAPCIKKHEMNTNLEKGIELIYHSFKIRAPRFPSSDHHELWIERTKDNILMKWSPEKDWAIYPGMNGQILIFNNVFIDPILGTDDLWTEEVCIGRSHSHSRFFKTNPTMNLNEYEKVDTLLLSTTPDSGSFQHFTDRVSVVWSQGSIDFKVPREELSILSGKKPTNSFINDMYNIIARDHYHLQAVHAKKLIYSCRSPLVHPFTLQKMSDEIMKHYDVKPIPYAKRKKIVYFTRSNGDNNNKGRSLLDEDKILDHLKSSLKNRNKGEELIVFERRNYPNLKSLVEFFRGVKAVFGPHGATFYNTRFAPRQLAVLEIQPRERIFFRGFWEQASLLEQYYGAFFAENASDDNDMIVRDVKGFVKFFLNLIDECEIRQPTDILQKHYHWIIQ